MAGSKKMKDYGAPAGRPGRARMMGAGVRELTADDIWTDRQRDLFRAINDKREALDGWEKIKQLRTDELCILLAELHETGMKKSRISKLFKLSSYSVGDYIERAETARALLAERE